MGKLRVKKPSRSGKNISDPRNKRATYGTKYPIYEVQLTKKEHLTDIAKPYGSPKAKNIKALKLRFKFITKTIEDFSFGECNFHTEKGLKLNTIERLTFRNCTFKSCFLGTINFYKVSAKTELV